MLIPLTELLNAHGSSPGAVGHLAGAITGALLLWQTLRDGTTTQKTIWLMDRISTAITALHSRTMMVREVCKGRIFSTAAMIGLLFAAVILICVQSPDAYGFYFK